MQAKAKVWAGGPGAAQGRAPGLAFPASRSLCAPWSRTSSSVFRASKHGTSSSRRVGLIRLPPRSPLQDLWSHWGRLDDAG